MVGYIQRAELKTATGEEQSIFLCVDGFPQLDFAMISVGGIFNAPGVPVVAERNDATPRIDDHRPDLRRRIFASTGDDRREVEEGLIPGWSRHGTTPKNPAPEGAGWLNTSYHHLCLSLPRSPLGLGFAFALPEDTCLRISLVELLGHRDRDAYLFSELRIVCRSRHESRLLD